jgi:hypothetical protein
MRRLVPVTALGGALALAVAMVLPAVPAGAGTGGAQVPLAGTGAPQTGAFSASGGADATQVEFPTQGVESGTVPFPGQIVDRSLSTGVGPGASVQSGQKAKSNPVCVNGFEGLNLYQQRYARGGNQFAVEPPDQGLCVGGGYVLEAVNYVLNVYNSSGGSLLPDNPATNIVAGFPRDVGHAVDLNSFFGYPPAINRTTGRYGEFVTDPSCLYDAATQRWFVAALTLDVNPANGAFTTTNHILQALRAAGAWHLDDHRWPRADGVGELPLGWSPGVVLDLHWSLVHHADVRSVPPPIGAADRARPRRPGA